MCVSCHGCEDDPAYPMNTHTCTPDHFSLTLVGDSSVGCKSAQKGTRMQGWSVRISQATQSVRLGWLAGCPQLCWA